MIRLDVGQDSGELAYRNAITLVPVLGQLTIDTDDETRAIDAGSVLEAEADTPHTLSCDDAADCLFCDGP